MKYVTIRVMFTLVARYDSKMKQMNVATVFLNGDIDKVIFIKQPEGFIDLKNSRSCMFT